MHWFIYICIIFSLSFYGSLFPIDNGILVYPASWPTPRYDFSANPLDSQKIAIGRRLFYDPILSIDSTISCSSCHLPYTAFTHVDHALSHGVEDRIGRRNAPSLVNLAWSEHFMWDGAIVHLDMQSLFPMTHPKEMGESLAGILKKLRRSSTYSKLFRIAFKEDTLSIAKVLQVLSQFQLVLISSNAKYDQYISGTASFSKQEEKGHNLFKLNCSSCHTPPFFTSTKFKSNGLPLDSNLLDLGRFEVTQDSADMRRFKIPSLRNIAYTYPYMHDGRFKTLSEVLDHYQKTGHTLNGEHDFLAQINLSNEDKVDLIAFLRTLTDRSFMFNTTTGFLPIE